MGIGDWYSWGVGPFFGLCFPGIVGFDLKSDGEWM